MFDGLVDIGVGYFNNMGKQESVYFMLEFQVYDPFITSNKKINSTKSRNNDRQPHWEHYEIMKRNWNLYSVGTLAEVLVVQVYGWMGLGH